MESHPDYEHEKPQVRISQKAEEPQPHPEQKEVNVAIKENTLPVSEDQTRVAPAPIHHSWKPELQESSYVPEISGIRLDVHPATNERKLQESLSAHSDLNIEKMVEEVLRKVQLAPEILPPKYEKNSSEAALQPSSWESKRIKPLLSFDSKKSGVSL